MIQLIPNIQFEQATLADYPAIQNMARFYVYDMSRFCGELPGWECPENGLYESFDYKHYFEASDRHAFLITVNKEKAGFALINNIGTSPRIDWNMGEFFILAKFQGKGIGEYIANKIFEKLPGAWEISVIPENVTALTFWRKVVSRFTEGRYVEEVKDIDYDKDQPKRSILSFDIKVLVPSYKIASIRKAIKTDIPQMVVLSDKKRSAYEKAQPQFWHRAKKANEKQAQWFEWLLSKNNHILLVSEMNHQIVGFIMGELKSAPEVYDPGGLSLMIDDFCVESPELWSTIGEQLLRELQHQAKQRGAVQTLVVCGHHDESKRQFLKREGLSIASEWYVGEIKCS